MTIEIRISRHGHCSNCSWYVAKTTAPDGYERYAESNERGSEHEAIGYLVTGNPDIFGKIEIKREGR